MAFAVLNESQPSISNFVCCLQIVHSSFVSIILHVHFVFNQGSNKCFNWDKTLSLQPLQTLQPLKPLQPFCNYNKHYTLLSNLPTTANQEWKTYKTNITTKYFHFSTSFFALSCHLCKTLYIYHYPWSSPQNVHHPCSSTFLRVHLLHSCCARRTQVQTTWKSYTFHWHKSRIFSPKYTPYKMSSLLPSFHITLLIHCVVIDLMRGF